MFGVNFTENNSNDAVERRNILHPRRKRKFPGPAGLLPDLNEKDIVGLNSSKNPASQKVAEIINNCSTSESKTSRRNNRTRSASPLSTQAEKELAVLSYGPREDLLQQLNLNENEENCPSNLMTIEWIQSSNFPPGTKIPFLLGVVQEVPDVTTTQRGEKKTPVMQLIDSTGTIKAAVDPRFIFAHGKDLVPGAAIAVTNAGLMTFKKNIMLAIPSNSVICLASNGTSARAQNAHDSEDSAAVKAQATYMTESGVKIVFFSDFSLESVLNNYKQLSDPQLLRRQYLEKAKAAAAVKSGQSPKPQLLFSVVGHEANSELFVNFEDEDEDDELFRAFDLEAAENEYLSQKQKSLPQASSVQLPVSTTKNVTTITEQPPCTTLEDSEEDEFDRELAALDDNSLRLFESSQLLPQAQKQKNSSEPSQPTHSGSSQAHPSPKVQVLNAVEKLPSTSRPEPEQGLSAFDDKDDDSSFDMFESSQPSQLYAASPNHNNDGEDKLPQQQQDCEIIIIDENSTQESNISQSSQPSSAEKNQFSDNEDDDEFFSDFGKEIDAL